MFITYIPYIYVYYLIHIFVYMCSRSQSDALAATFGFPTNLFCLLAAILAAPSCFDCDGSRDLWENGERKVCSVTWHGADQIIWFCFSG